MRFFLDDAYVSEISLVARVHSFSHHLQRYNYYNPRMTHGFAFFFEGDIKFYYDGMEPFEAKEKSFVYLPQGVSYHTYPEKAGDFILINFSTLENMPDKPFGTVLSNNTQLQGLFMSALKCFRQKRVGANAELKAAVYSIISLVQAASSHGYLPYEHYRKLEPAINYINDNFLLEEIKISKLARLCDMSRKYFTKLFATYYETTPKQYLINKRIDFARQLLVSDTNFSITQIAEQSGFNNTYYFSKLFKQRVGVTPSEYRRNG